MSPINLSNLINFLSRLNLLDGGYNIINTIFYSIIGILVYFFIVYPYLIFRKFKINLYFIYSVIIFTVIGAILRMFSFNFFFEKSLEYSTNPLSLGFYIYYPNLFIIILLFYFFVFEISYLISKKIKFSHQKTIFYLSIIIFIPFLILLLINILNWFIFLKIIFFSLLVFFIVYFLFKLFKSKLLFTTSSKIALFSQILDSMTTFYAISYFSNIFYEKHILSSLIISINPFLFVIVKVIFCLVLLYLIDYFIDDNNLNNYFKLFIIIIGLSTGLRNLLIIVLSIL